MRSAVLGLLGMTLAVGCANPYSAYYAPVAHAVPSETLVSHVGEPRVLQGKEHKGDALALVEQGYWQIGYSHFSHTNLRSTNGAMRKAKALGAELVVLYGPMNQRSESGSRLAYRPGQTSTTTHSGRANAYGTGGYAVGNYSGQSTTTTPGTFHAVPYQVTRYDYGATYWARIDPRRIRFGVHVAPLPPETRQELQRNTGALVKAVVNGTPAFTENILRGDVITQLGDTSVTDPESFLRAVDRYAGQTVTVALIREGTAKTAKVKLSPGLK